MFNMPSIDGGPALRTRLLLERIKQHTYQSFNVTST